MTLYVHQEAVDWFKNEMGLEDGDFVQFFLKIYGGIPTIHPNYFLGVAIGENGPIKYQHEVDGITFYVNEDDGWLFDDYQMEVVQKNDDVDYIFNEPSA